MTQSGSGPGRSASHGASGARAGMTQGLRVLIVGDPRGPADALREVLGRLMSLVPHIASDAAGARQAMRGGPFTLVLVDERLPDMSGRALLESIADAQCGWKILVTGAAEMAEGEAAALACGAHGFLRKPIDAGALVRLSEDVLMAYAE